MSYHTARDGAGGDRRGGNVCCQPLFSLHLISKPMNVVKIVFDVEAGSLCFNSSPYFYMEQDCEHRLNSSVVDEVRHVGKRTNRTKRKSTN